MKNRIRIRQITDASLICAFYVVFFLASKFSGLQLEYNLFFLLPIPIALYAVKYGFKVSLIPTVATFIVSFFTTYNILYPLVYVLPGLIMGSLLGGILVKTKLRPIFIILILTLFCVGVEILSFFVLSSLLDLGNIYSDIDYIINQISSFLEKLSTSYDLVLLRGIIEGCIPTLIIITSLMDALLVYLMFYLLATKLKFWKLNNISSPINFNRIPLFVGVVYLVITFGFFISISAFNSTSGFAHLCIVILMNLYLIYNLFYLYVGLKSCTLYARFKNKKYLNLISFLLIFIFPIFFVVVGLLENFFDFSAKMIQNISQDEENNI